MASCSRAHALKAAFVVACLLILLFNLFGSRWDSLPVGFPRISSTQWPKRTRANSEGAAVVVGRLDPWRAVANPNNDTNSNSPNSGSANVPMNLMGQQPGSNNLSAVPHLGGSANVLSQVNHYDTKRNSTSIDTSNNLPENLVKRNNSISSNSETSSSLDNVRKGVPPEDLVQLRSNQTTSNATTTTTTASSSNQTENETGIIINSLLKQHETDECPPIPPNLDGPIEVDVSYEPLTSVERKYAPKLRTGGQYTPQECTPRDRVAVIVPYRDREHHLPVFLKNLHPFLMKQQIEYGVYIVEQAAGSQFNRASLMNVGFVEALKQHNWDCMVFHDVDLLPMDDRNLYTCPDQPRHMSVAVDTFGFKLPYSTIFGGVSAMTVKQFRAVNGFSNSFWGWGGEDDDMSNRIKHVGYHIARYPINIARYTMLNHKKEKANPKRYEKLVTGAKRFDSDGLNSLRYQLLNLIRKPLFTWVHVDLSPESS